MKLFLIKLGGSLITEKDKPYTSRPEIISNIMKQIADVYNSERNFDLILGNGGGSFPHQSASKYKTINGFNDEEGAYGACHVHTDAIQLHYEVLREGIIQRLPLFSIQPSACLMTVNRQPVFSSTSMIEQALSSRMIPCVYGDVILDKAIGATIYSTEEILNIIARRFKEKKLYSEITIIHLGKFDGVLDGNKKIIPEITPANFESVKKFIGNSDHTDVTGGMIKKVEEALSIAKKGISSLILNGEKKLLLSASLKGEIVPGTKITS